MGEFSQFALVPEQGAVPQMEQLDAQMQSRIRDMAARIDVRDSAAVMGFGAKAQKEMNAFTSIALAQMLREDVKPLSGVMQTLAEQIRARGCAAQPAPSIEAGVARAVELGGQGPVCALGTLYFSGDVRRAFTALCGD